MLSVIVVVVAHTAGKSRYRGGGEQQSGAKDDGEGLHGIPCFGRRIRKRTDPHVESRNDNGS